MQFNTLGLKNGILISVPVPKEEEANGQVVKAAINQALEEATK